MIRQDKEVLNPTFMLAKAAELFYIDKENLNQTTKLTMKTDSYSAVVIIFMSKM